MAALTGEISAANAPDGNTPNSPPLFTTEKPVTPGFSFIGGISFARGAWQFRWGFSMRLSQPIQFGVDECRRALTRAGRWLPALVLATGGRLKNSIIPD